MFYPKDAQRLKDWEKGVTDSRKKDPKLWDTYDDHIKAIVPVFNQFLAGKSLYKPLDWKFIKALNWVESGPQAPGHAWYKRPMQIGNKGDGGLHDLLTTPQGKLIMPLQFKVGMTEAAAKENPKLNIIAGTAYLLRRLANFNLVFDPISFDKKSEVTPIVDGKGIIGTIDPSTTTRVMDPLTHESIPVDQKHRRAVHSVHAAHAPKPKAHLGIIGWKILSSEFAMNAYNKGDGNYADKMDFAYKIIKEEG